MPILNRFYATDIVRAFMVATVWSSRRGTPRREWEEKEGERAKRQKVAGRGHQRAPDGGGAASSAHTQAMQARMDAMLAWIREAGVQWNDDDLLFKVEAGSGGKGGGVLVLAKRDLSPNMGLARIPKSVCLSVLNVKAVHSRCVHSQSRLFSGAIQQLYKGSYF